MTALVQTSPAVRQLSALLRERTGQHVSAARAWRIETVLQPILKQWNMATVEALVVELVRQPAGPLADAVVDRLLNQETSFFRDMAVIEQVGDAIAALGRAIPDRRLRVWSAGCSNGQEPLSLAMLLSEKFGDAAPDIVASDVSLAAVARARAARFSQFEVQRGLSTVRMLRWFDQDGDDWIARPELIRRIAFRRQNIVADPPPAGQFDMILCRNVLLYFDAATRAAAFERLAASLRPDGLLVLGAGETTIGQTGRFEPSRRFRGFYDRAA